MDKFLTTYNKAYTKKKLTPFQGKRKYFVPTEYENSLNVPFKKHIDVDESGSDCVEEVEAYLKNAKDNYPSVAKRFPGENVVDKSVIRRSNLFDVRTEYQMEFCDIDEEIEYKNWLKRNALVLPEDIFIPLTTQTSSYRKPIMLNSRAYHITPVPKASNNLEPNYKVRKILNVTTGWSDYTNKIGNLGNLIIEQELHGPVRHDFKKEDI